MFEDTMHTLDIALLINIEGLTQYYMCKNFENGISREDLNKLADDFMKRYNKNSEILTKLSLNSNYYALWILEFCDKDFIMPIDLSDEVIDNYIENYRGVNEDILLIPIKKYLKAHPAVDDNEEKLTDTADEYYKY